MDGLPGTLVGDGCDPDGADSIRTDAHLARLRSIVLDISTTLMTAEPDEFETKLRWSLGSVGGHVGADRSYILRQRDGAFDRVTEWTADGIDAPTDRSLDPDEQEWLFDRLEGFESVAVAGPTDLPSDATTRAVLRDDGARSAVLLPMVDDWSLVGVVGFETVDATHEWPASEVDVLRTAADVVAHSQARVRRERRLAEQNERLEAFAGVISHDLRNPLNVVSGSLELARAETDSEHLDRAARAADRMDDLVEKVLALARDGEDIGETRRVRLESVARSAWTAVDSRGADLRLPDDPTRIEADPDRLQQAFENLFRNAIEHAGADVTVRVGARSDGDGFYVEDDGPGIPPDRRASVFDRGYTADGGTGLGLSIVRGIVEAHGWSIGVGAAADGGARFDVTGVVSATE